MRGRAPLARVFLLIDGRHGAKPIDIEMLDLLDRSAVSYQIVLTKQDEVRAAEREERLAATLALISQASRRVSGGDFHLLAQRRWHRDLRARDCEAAGGTRPLKP